MKAEGKLMADKIFCSYSDSFMFCNHVLRDLKESRVYESHSHNIYELIYIKGGDVKYGVGGKEYRARVGDLLITRPYCEHYLHPNEGVQYERYDLLFNENTLGFSFSEKLPDDLAPLNIESNRTLRRLFEKFDYYYDNLSGEELKVVFNGLVREICVNILLAFADSAVQRITENKVVIDALDYIDANLLSINSVEDISSALFITKSHLQHMFSKHLGKTPKRYVTEKRLMLARREIAQGARPAEVYARYGFAEYSSFFRAYKKAFGVAPSVSMISPHPAVTPENTIVKSLPLPSGENG